jgi:hypothetical protein
MGVFPAVLYPLFVLLLTLQSQAPTIQTSNPEAMSAAYWRWPAVRANTDVPCFREEGPNVCAGPLPRARQAARGPTAADRRALRLAVIGMPQSPGGPFFTLYF